MRSIVTVRVRVRVRVCASGGVARRLQAQIDAKFGAAAS